MLSLGTEDFFAFWTASKSVGLPERSPPPVRAATSMFLISLAKSLPRLASMPAFLCLVVAHLEWPLMAVPLSFPASSAGLLGQVAADDVDEQRMHPAVPGQFGVEARGHQIPLADGHDPTVGRSPDDPAEDDDPLAGLLDPGRPDEDGVHRRHPSSPSKAMSDSKQSTCRPKALRRTVTSRPPIGLLVRRRVEQPVGEQDHPGAGAVGRQPAADGGAQRLEQPEPGGQLDHRRRLAAREDQPVDGGQLLRPPHGHRLGTLLAQGRQMLADVALQGEHPDDGPVGIAGHDRPGYGGPAHTDESPPVRSVRTGMEPVTEQDVRFGDPESPPTPWADAVARARERRALLDLHGAQATAGRTSHPLPAVWSDGRLHFCTGPAEQKAVNLAGNPHVALTTGTNRWKEGLDLVVEGSAVQVTDDARLRTSPTSGAASTTATGTSPSSTGRSTTRTAGSAVVFEVAPTKVLAFAKGRFAQTRYRFPAADLSCPWQRDLDGPGRRDAVGRRVRARVAVR